MAGMFCDQYVQHGQCDQHDQMGKMISMAKMFCDQYGQHGQCDQHDQMCNCVS